MTWQLDLAVRGRLSEYFDAAEDAGASATTIVGRRIVRQLVKELRALIRGAGLGNRLPNALRGELIPDKGVSYSKIGHLYSKATAKGQGRPGGPVDIITVFLQGAEIHAQGKGMLAIPISAWARSRRGGFLQPSDFPKGTFTLIPSTRNPNVALLVFKDQPRDAPPAFLLLKNVRIKSRYQFQPTIDRILGKMPDAIEAEWTRQLGKRGFAAAA